MDALPPGLNGAIPINIISGSHPSYDADWMEFSTSKLYTNVFVWNNDTGKILLGLKKRGFGVNFFNGFGGKVEVGETPLQGAARELKEEADIEAELTHVGTILFYGEGEALAHHVEVFSSNSFQGVPVESEEMRPTWFKLPDTNVTDSEGLLEIPFKQMWPDTKLWIPLMLSGKRFIGRADFADIDGLAKKPEDKEMARWWFATIE